MDAIDAYTTPEKQAAMLDLLARVYDRGSRLVQMGAPVGRLQDEITLWPRVLRLGPDVKNGELEKIRSLADEIDEQMARIEKDYS
jgi:hypothetical protein